MWCRGDTSQVTRKLCAGPGAHVKGSSRDVPNVTGDCNEVTVFMKLCGVSSA
jgi:hypothetical protein